MIDQNTEKREHRPIEQIKNDLERAEAEYDRAQRAKDAIEAELLEASADRFPKFF